MAAEIDKTEGAPGLTPEQEANLRAMQAELAGAEASPWEPQCVARAFGTWAMEAPFVFTMQTWIDLEAVHSPFLHSELPEAERALVEFEQAFAAFGHLDSTPAEAKPGDLILLGKKMIHAIESGFAMRVSMKPPKGFESSQGGDGFGQWLPVMACLKAQLTFSWSEALALPVSRAFGLIFAHRRNQGWTVACGGYQLRDISAIEEQ